MVAEEVRQLAERSGKATKEIAQLIATIQKDTVEAVKAAEKGGEIAVNANQAFNEIHRLITHNADMINDIVAQIRKVEKATCQVANASKTIASAAEESAAGIEEISASAEDMASMAEKLRALMLNFKILHRESGQMG